MKCTYLLLLLLPTLAQAATTILRERKVTHRGEANSSLVEFSLIEQKKKTRVGGDDSFSTDVRIIYKTKNVAQLKDYAIVQFIRGCQYSSCLLYTSPSPRD